MLDVLLKIERDAVAANHDGMYILYACIKSTVHVQETSTIVDCDERETLGSRSPTRVYTKQSRIPR